MNKYGLRQKPTFDSIIEYLDEQPTIKYPDILASVIMDSAQMSQFLGDGAATVELQKQQEQILKGQIVQMQLQQSGVNTRHYNIASGATTPQQYETGAQSYADSMADDQEEIDKAIQDMGEQSQSRVAQLRSNIENMFSSVMGQIRGKHIVEHPGVIYTPEGSSVVPVPRYPPEPPEVLFEHLPSSSTAPQHRYKPPAVFGVRGEDVVMPTGASSSSDIPEKAEDTQESPNIPQKAVVWKEHLTTQQKKHPFRYMIEYNDKKSFWSGKQITQNDLTLQFYLRGKEKLIPEFNPEVHKERGKGAGRETYKNALVAVIKQEIDNGTWNEEVPHEILKERVNSWNRTMQMVSINF